ncbi:class I SAM-dependent methyltransferase [Streptomyces sp. ACA25]|nr:class I SAM-dependent methyltransferase [Streptomyces sp. ACA25]MDB1090306.1 class I SAM-dependent methyltransferase [Streptomyces sp. ACA25]
MYADSIAEVYDLVYQGRGKDYEVEAEELASLAKSRRPDARTLLDVACGTGLHLRHLAGLFDDVGGVELAPDMLSIARQRNPGAALHLGDMRDFDLGHRYDVITCMFSSVGHLSTPGELESTMHRFAAHLTPGGVAVVEPWWFPETFTPGYVGASIVEVDGRTISRVSHSVREGGATRIEVHYLVAGPDTGIRHFDESHLISLFERADYERAFERAGFTVEYLTPGPSGRGLFVGVRG